MYNQELLFAAIIDCARNDYVTAKANTAEYRSAKRFAKVVDDYMGFELGATERIWRGLKNEKNTHTRTKRIQAIG